MRTFISDFAVIIAIIIGTLLDFLLGLDTPKLIVPPEFKVTRFSILYVINDINL